MISKCYQLLNKRQNSWSFFRNRRKEF